MFFSASDFFHLSQTRYAIDGEAVNELIIIGSKSRTSHPNEGQIRKVMRDKDRKCRRVNSFSICCFGFYCWRSCRCRWPSSPSSSTSSSASRPRVADSASNSLRNSSTKRAFRFRRNARKTWCKWKTITHFKLLKTSSNRFYEDKFSRIKLKLTFEWLERLL